MAPRLVVVGLASDYGCQVQITNIGEDLLDVLGIVDLVYWQLASSLEMPADYDVAIVEGAVTLEKHVETLRAVRATAQTVIAVGACAINGGIPALASTGDLTARYDSVYGPNSEVARGRITPLPASAVIDVDYQVPGCPLDTTEFLRVLSRALLGLSGRTAEEPLCASCKAQENICFHDRGEVCVGLVIRTGCGAKCPTLGRACTGCRGIAADSNLDSAYRILAERGVSVEEFSKRLALYNTLDEGVH